MIKLNLQSISFSLQGIDFDPIIFELPKQRGGTVYRLNLAIIRVKFRLLKSDDSNLEDGSQTVLINGMATSLFKEMKMKINGNETLQ